MKNFALIGAAGYIAPRHMKAIMDTGNKLIAALDPYDGVGIMDSYYPDADFFTEFERFDRHVDKLRRKGVNLDFVSICSPNFLHDSHIRFGLRNNADVICEKPIVLNPWNVEALKELEKETGKNIYNILQLRLHSSVIELKNKIDKSEPGKIYDVDLSYITSRGHWYYTSWKGDVAKSGGVATNIGVHFFDMLTWIFGGIKENVVHLHEHDRAAGFLQLEKARVRWFLSINYDTIPDKVKQKGMRTFRSITVDDEDFEFSGGFTELHTRSYEDILAGEGFRIADAEKAINAVYQIRHQKPLGLKGDYHPLARLPLAKHPFKRINPDNNL
ncbi:MAG: Gfo/Idh/MocA family oxidoreductase [Prolixibacteraceae bacterium]